MFNVCSPRVQQQISTKEIEANKRQSSAKQFCSLAFKQRLSDTTAEKEKALTRQGF